MSDLAVVVAAGRELGLEGVEEYLRSDEGKREVLQVGGRSGRDAGAQRAEGYCMCGSG